MVHIWLLRYWRRKHGGVSSMYQTMLQTFWLRIYFSKKPIQKMFRRKSIFKNMFVLNAQSNSFSTCDSDHGTSHMSATDNTNLEKDRTASLCAIIPARRHAGARNTMLERSLTWRSLTPYMSGKLRPWGISTTNIVFGHVQSQDM